MQAQIRVDNHLVRKLLRETEFSMHPASNHANGYRRTLPVRTCTVSFVSELVGMASNPISSTGNGLLTSKVVHLALPVRWSFFGQENRGGTEMACTYDIHPQGARLLSARAVSIGDLVMVERGRNKSVCQVVWCAEPDSPLRGQFAVRCVEGRTPWEEELRQMEEEYQPVILDAIAARASSRSASQATANRRRRPRFYVDGQAEVVDGVQHVAGEIQQISECGARLTTMESLRPGSDFRLTLNVFDVSLALKAQVKYLVGDLGMGVEFRQIRRGDRPLLSYVLSRLRTRRMEEFTRPEPLAESLAATV